MDDQQFSDVLALGNTLPGPINTKMAGYIGYRVGGLLGMVTALLATIVPTVILMLILLTSFNQFKDNTKVKGMTHAVVPIVGVMLGVLTWQFFKKSKDSLGWKMGVILLVGCYLLIEVVHIHPGIVIGVLLIAAFILPDKKNNKEKMEGKSNNV